MLDPVWRSGIPVSRWMARNEFCPRNGITVMIAVGRPAVMTLLIKLILEVARYRHGRSDGETAWRSESKRSRLPFLRLNLGPKAVLSAALLIAINTALLVGAGYWSLTRDFDVRAERDIDLSLRTLSLAFGEAFPDAKIAIRDGVVERIEIPRMPEFSDHRIVDRATSYVGGNATLFVYDDASQQFVRRTTNVKKENGDRAVGTQLAADHPGQAMLRRGQAYKGPAMLFGRRFYTAYQPVFNPAGKVIGIVYVGIPTAQLDAMLWQAIGAMAIAGAIASLLALAMTMALARRVTKRLKGRGGNALPCWPKAGRMSRFGTPIATTKSASSPGPSMCSRTTASSAVNSKPSASH